MTTLIAHRGASAEAPENTLASIKRAIDVGVDCIEIDIHLTKDGVPVVIHDSSLARTTNEKRRTRVENLTLAEVKNLDAGSWFSPSFKGEPIPTLEEVLALDRKGARLMIEIKHSPVPADEVTEKILSVLPAKDESIILGSFETDIVRSLQKTAYSLIGIVENPLFVKTFLDMGINHLALWSQIMEPHQTEILHGKGVTLWVFTIDDPAKARFLRSIGVDGIITNDPRRLQQCF